MLIYLITIIVALFGVSLLPPINHTFKSLELHIFTTAQMGYGTLSGKMLLVWNVVNNKIDAYTGVG